MIGTNNEFATICTSGIFLLQIELLMPLYRVVNSFSAGVRLQDTKLMGRSDPSSILWDNTAPIP